MAMFSRHHALSNSGVRFSPGAGKGPLSAIAVERHLALCALFPRGSCQLRGPLDELRGSAGHREPDPLARCQRQHEPREAGPQYAAGEKFGLATRWPGPRQRERERVENLELVIPHQHDMAPCARDALSRHDVDGLYDPAVTCIEHLHPA